MEYMHQNITSKFLYILLEDCLLAYKKITDIYQSYGYY